MSSIAEDMVAALDAFTPDPDDVSTVGDLYRVTEGFDALSTTDKSLVVPAMFRVVERFPHADLGSPGPLVHSIEQLGIPNYERLLIESVRRRPMYLNLWMVNRILNVTPSGPLRSELLDALRAVRDDPQWTGVPADEAARFLKHQGEQEG